MRLSLCVGCGRGKRVIRHVAEVLVAEAKRDVVAFLVRNPGIALCDACLAFATERSLRDVAHVLNELEPFPEFRRHEAGCLVCSREKPVTVAVIDESRPLTTDTECYRSWRFELLSYAIGTGWRALVLIKRPAGMLPGAPSLIWGVFPSKVAADRHALHAAKEWVDKHSIG
jgi:hypothetical protein